MQSFLIYLTHIQKALIPFKRIKAKPYYLFFGILKSLKMVCLLS